MDRLEELKLDFYDSNYGQKMVVEDMTELIKLLIKESDRLYGVLEDISAQQERESEPHNYKEDLD